MKESVLSFEEKHNLGLPTFNSTRLFSRLSVQHSFPGHNFVVCGWLKILFGTKDRHSFRWLPSRSQGDLYDGI